MYPPAAWQYKPPKAWISIRFPSGIETHVGLIDGSWTPAVGSVSSITNPWVLSSPFTVTVVEVNTLLPELTRVFVELIK